MDRKLKEARSKFKYDSKIKECFSLELGNCTPKIKSAHSLQKNGVLNILEFIINKNKVVYSFLHPKLIGFMTWYGFEPLGKNDCSTFHGFCDFHDSALFSPIENNEINIDSDEHCFLLCYRAFAKEYHAKIEVTKGFQTNIEFNKPNNKKVQQQFISGGEIAIRDLKIVKNKLNKLLQNKEYKGLEYFTYSIPYTIPIACAASITPSFSYSGKVLNKSENPDDVYENIMFTVLPTKSETHVVMGWFSEDKRSSLYVDELEVLSNTKLENAITSILIGDVENTFISPIIWNRMSKIEKDFLMQEITLTSPFIMPMFEESFFLSSLNLLEKKYAI
jgi:hypothetical protein